MRKWVIAAALCLLAACDKPASQDAAATNTTSAANSSTPAASATVDPLADLDARLAELRTDAWSEATWKRLNAARPRLNAAGLEAAVKRERAATIHQLLKRALAANPARGRAKTIKLLRVSSEPIEQQAVLEVLRGHMAALDEGQRKHVVTQGLKGSDLALATLVDLLTELKSERAFDALLGSDELRVRKAGGAGLIAAAASLEAAVATIVERHSELAQPGEPGQPGELGLHDTLPYGAALATRADEARPIAAKLLADPSLARAQIGLAFYLFAAGEADKPTLLKQQSDSRAITPYSCRPRLYRDSENDPVGDLSTLGAVVKQCALNMLTESRITIHRHHEMFAKPPAGSLLTVELDRLLGAAPAASIAKGEAMVGGAGVAGSKVKNAHQVVAKMRPAFRRCYQSGLQRNADLAGSVTLVARIGPEGEVQAMGGGGGGGLAMIVPCLKAVVKRAVFAPPDGGAAVVSIPITFVKQ